MARWHAGVGWTVEVVSSVRKEEGKVRIGASREENAKSAESHASTYWHGWVAASL